MRSAFSRGRRRIVATSRPRTDETYDLKGLNLVAPDQAMPENESPWTTNTRRFARNANENRVAIRTRSGSQYLSSPVGEALGAQNTAAVVEDLAFTTDRWVSFPITATSDGGLTKLELYIKKAAGTGGHAIFEFFTDNSGFPGEKVGATSILSSLIGTDYAYVACHLMDAPEQESGETYWVRAKIQALGLGTYYLGATAGSGVLVTTDEAVTYTPTALAVRHKSYVSTLLPIKGFTRRYPQNKQNRTLFAQGTNIYAVPDNPATPVSIDANVHPDSLAVRFAQIDDRTIWVDGEGGARWWDGDVAPKLMQGVPGVPTHVAIFQNRALFVPKNDPTRVNFSALYDFENFPSVNFFYVPSPKSPDHITSLNPFQDGLTIFTSETKHIVLGSDISTFTRKEAKGTKGAIRQEATAVDRNAIYFVADDKMVYSWNGAADRLLSGKVEPLLQLADPNTFNLHLYRNQLRVYYREAATGEQQMLLLDIEQEQWFLDTGRRVMGSLEWTQNDNELIEFSSRVGQIFYGERGGSNLGKPIDFVYHTAYKAYGSGAAKDRIKRFRPVVRPAEAKYELMVGRDIDFNDTPDMRPWLVDSGGAVWGAFVWGDGTKWGGKQLIDNVATMSGRGKHTQYRFEHSGVETIVELYGYIALIKSGRPR